MKKLIAIFAIMSIMLLFSACSYNQNSNKQSEVENSTTYEIMDNSSETDLAEIETTEPKSSLPLFAAYDFSNGVALVQLYDSRNWVLINTKGEVVYDAGNGTISGCEKAKNGVIVLNNKLISTDGNLLASPETTGYDEIITPNEQIGGDYFFVTKVSDTFQETATLIGIIDKTGQWVEQPRSDYPKFEYISSCDYLGDNHYLFRFNKGNYVYNPITKKGFSVEGYDSQYDVIRYCAGKGRLINYQGVYSLNDSGKKELMFEGNAFAQEQNCNAIYICNVEKENNGMYDFDGNKLIDLSKYNLADPNEEIPAYCDGKVVVNVKNNQDNKFITVIDKSGNYLFEPIRKTNRYINGCTVISDGLIWYEADNSSATEYHYIDITGKDAFEPINAKFIRDFHDGLAMIITGNNKEPVYFIDKTGKRVIG